MSALTSWKLILAASLLAAWASGATNETDSRKYPKDFKFALATASYQVEGAWDQPGKGWSIWDVMIHMEPWSIKQRNNADVTCDSFHKYKEDVENLKQLGVDVYRMSISWPRIMPRGTPDLINQAGVDYYHRVIDELLSKGIEPMITMYHWDMPEHIQNMGGFLYDGFEKYFADYADFLFKTYGYKVKWWTTFNEPLTILQGYNSQRSPPRLELAGTGEYVAGHNLLKAHAKAYHLYKDNYAYQNGKISLNINGNNCYPKNSSAENAAAVERCFAFGVDYFIHPIFSKEGDYPSIMKTQVAKLSKEQGVPNRLPQFTKEEIEYIRGTYDYLALHGYSSSLVSSGRNPSAATPSSDQDAEIIAGHDPSWKPSASDWLFVVPQGFRNLLVWVKKNYGAVPVFITEFGFTDHGTLEDDDRIDYLTDYFEEMKKAILDDGVNVIGAAVWSLMDNFEWGSGYTEKFGLIHVDFNDPERTRTWKKSAHWFKNFVKYNKEQ